MGTNCVNNKKTSDATRTNNNMTGPTQKTNVNIRQNNPQAKRQVSFGKTTTKVITNTIPKMYGSQRERGVRMVENKEKLSTPVRIEFNIPHALEEFNIVEACLALFEQLRVGDQYIRILTGNKTTIIWEHNMQLPESDQFIDLFSMQEQVFRKGHKKISLYCTIESARPINQLKFREPLKSYLVQNDIWIKPDLYATKVVSSPGFMTLAHPRITNKTEYTIELEESLSQTKLEENEEVVQEWKKHNPRKQTENGSFVPKFHLETSLRKWGVIHVEVISIHCSQEDAQYLKMLFAEASSQGLILKGLFIPTGLHLIEGKEVVKQLLEEQQNYIQRVTSVQIEGISVRDMYGNTGIWSRLSRRQNSYWQDQECGR